MPGAAPRHRRTAQPTSTADDRCGRAACAQRSAGAGQPYLENLMNVRPLHDRIIVDRLDEGEQQIGGIIIPDSAKEKAQQGTVVAVGSGRALKDGTRVPLDIKAGDKILFGKYSGQEIRLGGRDLFIMKEDDVLAVLETTKVLQPAKKGK
jgi:chaperonin GroES